jgi:peroxiredoxin 2/4
MAVLVGKTAPDFTAKAVLANNTIAEKFNLTNELKGKIGVLFFYPLNFTFVCPSEIIAFNNKLKEFQDRNAVLIGVSVDSPFSHLAYKNTPLEKGGIGNVGFPLVSDLTKQIARDYDVLLNESIAFRGTFIIDTKGIVRHQVINDLPLGRNIDEALRIIDAIQYNEQHGEVCPANWNKGDEAMKPTAEGVSAYLSKRASNS